MSKIKLPYKEERRARKAAQQVRKLKEEAEAKAAGVALPAVTKKQKKKEKKEKKRKLAWVDKESPQKSKKAELSTGDALEQTTEVEGKEGKADKKSKKRKAADEEVEDPADGHNAKEGKRKAKKSKTKSESTGTDGESFAVDATYQPPADFIALDDQPLKASTRNAPANSTISRRDSKKAKKEKSSKRENADDKNGASVETNGANSSPQDAQDGNVTQDPSAKKDRFIVFIGNLPYSATKEELQTHFAKVEPKEIRLGTDKKTNKPKGFAFVEFDRFDRMETCLKKFNHSLFPDGKAGRKINVELTAGGGGNTSSRKDKIQAKNEKLHDERQREREKRDELEEKQKERREKKEARQNKGKKDEPSESAEKPSQEHGVIHPSRLAMMQKPARSQRQQNGRY